MSRQLEGLRDRSMLMKADIRSAAKSAGVLFAVATPPPMTRSGALFAGLGTLFSFFVVMVFFKLAPKRQAESRFWRSVNQVAPPNFARRWPLWVAAGLVAFLGAQAFFQLVIVR
jgi:hypothetical protein